MDACFYADASMSICHCHCCGWVLDLDLVSFDSSHGFLITGEDEYDYLGGSIATGKVDGDSRDDIVAGAHENDASGRSKAGAAYVIWGTANAGNRSPLYGQGLAGYWTLYFVSVLVLRKTIGFCDISGS